MFPNISTQSQNLFKDCLGFARQLSQSPGLNCRLEVNLGRNYFNLQTGSPGNFPGKRKSPSHYRRDQRSRNPPWKGVLTPVNHGASSVAPGDPKGARKGRISQAPSFPPCRRRYPGQDIYYFHQISLSWRELEVLHLQKNEIYKYQPPLVQYECIGFTHFAPIQQLHPTLPQSLKQTPSINLVPLLSCLSST